MFFLYSLEYTQNHNTKIDIVNQFNIYNNTNISRTTFYEKEVKIPLSYYYDVYKKLNNIIIKHFYNKRKNTVISVDGTYNNTNVKNIKGYLETSLNMGFFNVNDDVSVELIFEGQESKNKEIESLEKFILKNKNNYKFNKIIFVLDRAYCSYKFFDFCYKNQIKYVIRFRNNCYKIPNENRIIKFKTFINETVFNNNVDNHLINNKKFNSVSLQTVNDYTLITNLNVNEYNDIKIKDIYHSRW